MIPAPHVLAPRQLAARSEQLPRSLVPKTRLAMISRWVVAKLVTSTLQQLAPPQQLVCNAWTEPRPLLRHLPSLPSILFGPVPWPRTAKSSSQVTVARRVTTHPTLLLRPRLMILVPPARELSFRGLAWPRVPNLFALPPRRTLTLPAVPLVIFTLRQPLAR